MPDNQDMFYEDEMPEEAERRDEDRKAQDRAMDPEELMPTKDNPEELNDMEYFLDLLDMVTKFLENAKRLPGGWAMVKYETIMKAMDDLRGNLPDAIQYGMNMYGQRHRILSNVQSEAKRQASEAEIKAQKAMTDAKNNAADIIAEADERAKRIVSDAMHQADVMVSREEITRRAQDEADELLSDAKAQARDIRERAAYEMNGRLKEAEEALASAMDSLRKQRGKLSGKDRRNGQ